MDNDKFEMTSEIEEKKNSSSDDNNANRLISGEECAGSNSEENGTTRVLQPFFVADTLEDDESIIPPSQEDSELLIPSTPAYESKSEKRLGNVDANDSTISILEETCVLERKAQCNDSSREDANTTACNENDMTQDLEELEETQPIIPSNIRIDHSFSEQSKNKSKEEEEEDDEWQLKFSETQTQEIISFEKNDQSDEEAETPKLLPVKDNEPEDDDDLPDTLSIEVPPRRDEDYYKNKKPETNDDAEVLETQSDDEIEPSQSCLSEYKGETISASFKVPPVVEISDEEISKASFEKETKNDGSCKSDADITMVAESERTPILSESESKNIFNDVKGGDDEESLSVKVIPAENDENCKKREEEKHSVSNTDEERTKNSEFVAETVETKSVEIISQESTKVCDEQNSKISETNGNQIEEINIFDDVVNTEMENKKIKSSKFVGKKEIRSKMLESGTHDSMTNSEEPSVEIINEKCKFIDESPSKIGKTKVENDVEVSEEERKKVPNTAEKTEVIETADVTKEAEISNKDSIEKADVQESKPQQKSNTESAIDAPKTTDSQCVKTAEIVPESSRISSGSSQESSKRISSEKIETLSQTFAKPSAPGRNFGFLKKQKTQSPGLYNEAFEKSEKKVGSFTDSESLENFFKSVGVTIDHEKLDNIFSKPSEEIELRAVFKIVNFEIFLKDNSSENEHHFRNSGISPVCSSGTTTSSTLSSKIASRSGSELADISSFSSGDMFPKTSTQKSPQKNAGLLETFEGKVLGEKIISPITPKQRTKTPASKRKRGGKKNVESSSSDASNNNEPKNKRAKGKGKAKAKIIEDKNDETEESTDIAPEEQPKKPTRRKKGTTTTMPDIKPEEIKSIIEHMETTTSTEDDSNFQEDANFGTILPGCKVMARWKDGYYYSGMVQSQESDGKWAVVFEDGLLRTISPECLIKIAILPKGTSVLVQSPDCYYDPGIVCGHFREGNKCGYEVELDNGVTRRYTRADVILSSDQAKLIMKNAPPTTPATMTINLDNIIDGKRKRKSIQSPVAPTPPVKKSPRITRSKKLDPNLDSTESSIPEAVISDKSKDSENEEPIRKKKKTTKGAKTAAAAPPTTTTEVSSVISTPSTSSATIPATSFASINKTVKVLPQRSAKKLFKDYAFLLTNADRKTVPKVVDTSDSDVTKEEEDIVPFDKDELCNHIYSGGGIILEKFDDIKKCTRKYIYLLANSYLRTMKYIQCIAAGISCIKHHWVQNCIFKSELLNLNSYILPAGYSLVTQQVIEWHGKTDVFKNCKIALVSAPENPFVYTWAPVLLAAKADFVQKWSLPSSVSGCSLVVDVLITNIQCPTEIIQSAKKRKIPMVSSEWIIQCLIMGEKLPYDAHPKFKYDA